MADITGLLARLRGGTPPAVPYDPAAARRAARQAEQSMHNDPDGPDRDPAAAPDAGPDTAEPGGPEPGVPGPGARGGDEPRKATPA
jgi:hypothetical protein